MASHRLAIPYLLFFLIFFVVAEVGACKAPNVPQDLVQRHACCTVADGTMPTGKISSWSNTWNCEGNLCCCCSSPGREPAAQASLRGVSDPPSLQFPPETFSSVISYAPEEAIIRHQAPLIPFPPLYLRNCAFLI